MFELVLSMTLRNGLKVVVWDDDYNEDKYEVEVCNPDNPFEDIYDKKGLSPDELLHYLVELQYKKL